MSASTCKRVGVIGAGPVGIEAAVHLVDAGFSVTVFERGSSVAANVREWGHVELFSSWALNMSPAGRRVLEQMGRPVPDDAAYPTGAEFASAYVDVLAAWLTQQSGRCDIRLGCEVTAIGRGHLLKKDDVGGRRQRARTPFRVLVAAGGGEEAAVGGLDFLLDCSGTWNQPNWCGVGGAPACNERALVAAGRVLQHIADPAATPRAFLGKTVAVVGTGASAITMINALRELAERHAETVRVEWIARGRGAPYARIENDPLPQRDRLHAIGNELAQGRSPACLPVTFRGGFGVAELALPSGAEDGPVELRLEGAPDADGADARADGADARAETVRADVVVSCCGFRPRDALWTELQVHQCYATAGPMKLAAALMASAGGGSGDCLAQVSHGPETLQTPEPGMLVLGMKSYGRSSAFLLKIGLQQVQDAVTLLKDLAAGAPA